jgi:ADP-ribosylglycohydrolase
MSDLKLNRAWFRDKVYACWMGKNIGGTLGARLEGRMYTHALTFYEPAPEKAAPNDDLDLQLVWLKMLEQEGVDPSVRTFAEYWNLYASRYPWNEYGFFMRNFDRGLRPPVAGCFENYFVDEMGSPIRSEIWACLHPGDPQTAARMAWKDSAVDHAGGEGMYGEMFWAALEAAAFVESDPLTLIQIGLNMIPLSSHVARSIREAVWCRQNGQSWGEAREKIASRFGGIQPCHAVPNHGFTIIGWLYGQDFGDRLCKAVNCGYDTDCTGATLGSVLGIIEGSKGIPRKWSAAIGEQIMLHKFTGPCDPPATIGELTDRTVALAEKAAARKDFAFGGATVLPSDLRTRLFCNEQAREALKQDIHAGVERCGNREVWFHYGGEPVLRPGIGKDVEVSVVPGPTPRLDLHVPDRWKCTRVGPARFHLLAPAKAINGQNHVSVALDGETLDFVILGPAEARGFEAGVMVPYCSRCGRRVEVCECPPAGKG